jgi:hypothetical protein
MVATTTPGREGELAGVEAALFLERDGECPGISDRELAILTLGGLSKRRADDYREWVKVGIALNSVDQSQSMLQEWDRWSRQSDKHVEGDCAKRWKGFIANGKLGIGSLIYWAKQDGWRPPSRRSSKPSGKGQTDDLRQYGIVPSEQALPKTPKLLPAWQPFPTDALPGVAGEFVRAAAAAIGCDEAYVALPMLAGLAGAVGNTRVVLLKKGWVEPCVIWTAIVGESGTMKSPALDAPLGAVRKKQAAELKKYKEEMRKHEAELLRHETAVTAWKAKVKKGSTEPPPEAPEEPTCIRYWVGDTTIEALAKTFKSALRGLLLIRDELAGWLNSFDQYRGGKGGDTAHWLTMHGARDLLVDRKSGGTTYIRQAALSLTGGIQPEILRKALAREHFEDGLAARLLVCMPLRKPKRWSDAEIPEVVIAGFAALVEELYGLEPNMDTEGDPIPAVLPLSQAARKHWIKFYNEHGQEQAACSGDLASAFSKLEGYAARLALVVQLIIDPHSRAIGAQAMQAGIRLSRWFMQECRRVYAVLGETEEDTDRRRLIELIKRKGGSITARDLAHSDRRFAGDAEAAKAVLDTLQTKGVGVWEHVPAGPKGGRPTEVFKLASSTQNDDPCLHNPQDPAESVGSGYGDNGDTQSSEGDEVAEWRF